MAGSKRRSEVEPVSAQRILQDEDARPGSSVWCCPARSVSVFRSLGASVYLLACCLYPTLFLSEEPLPPSPKLPPRPPPPARLKRTVYSRNIIIIILFAMLVFDVCLLFCSLHTCVRPSLYQSIHLSVRLLKLSALLFGCSERSHLWPTLSDAGLSLHRAGAPPSAFKTTSETIAHFLLRMVLGRSCGAKKTAILPSFVYEKIEFTRRKLSCEESDVESRGGKIRNRPAYVFSSINIYVSRRALP